MRAASITLLALLLAVSTTASAQEVLVLSPEPGERISGQEVLVAASFVGAGAKLEIDGVDYTAQAQIEGSVLTWKPAQPLAAGPHRAFVYALDANGKVIGQSDWSFTTMPLTESEAAAIKASGNAEPMTVGNTWLPHGTLILSGASASVSGAGSALRTTDNFQPNMWLNAGGLIGGGWRYSAHVHVSGAESEFQQPVNQYRFDLRGPFLRVSLGDVHPAMQSLILNGQRVRGVQGELRLGPARVSMVSGESRRAIPALVSTADGTVLRTGTFGQKLFAVRPAIGAGDRFQAGLTFMQVRDDVGSIPDIRVPSSATNPERSANSPPKDNLVAGFDLTFRFVGGRIMAQYANGVSLLANDISTGPLTEAGLDSIADAAGIGRIGIDPSKYRDYFILNSSVIPLDPRALTNVAHQARTSLRVGTHTLGAEWYSIGGSYYSLGYTALQRDRRGIRVYDSFTLINNSLVAAAGYDRDRDNLDESKLATTTSSGMFANLSWQQSRDAVLLSVSARVGSRLNNLPSTQAEAIDETNQAFSAAVGLPLGRFAGLRTRLNLNAAFIDRSDPANADADTRDTYYLGGIQAETAERTSDFSVAYGINRTEFGGTSGTDFGRLLVSGRRQLATGIAALIDVSRVAASSDATSTFPIDYNRLELIGGGEFEVIRSTLLTVNAGVISYSDGRDSSLDTKETIARVSLRRAF